MTEPTSQLVKDFWAFMSKETGSTIIQKADSELMKLVAWFLDVVNIQDDKQFMQDFTTTLHKNIYTPFEVGVGSRFWNQIKTCVHEHQHIEQGERDGWLTFGGRYLTSSSYRANYEAEAYGCDMELEYWRNPPGFSAVHYGQQRVESLKNYGCSAEDIQQAKQTISIRACVLEQGGVENKMSQMAFEWLNEHAPELCGL